MAGPEGVPWRFQAGCPIDGLQAAFLEFQLNSIWKRASAHENGAGMESGVDLDATKSRLASMRKDHDLAGKAGMNEQELASGIWCKERRYRQHYAGDSRL